MANGNLTNARNAKKDEFYTQFHDIEKEVSAYIEYNPNAFKGKTVLLPCDDPEWSNFTKYFAQNFERFKLKKLISTSYAVESKIYKVGYQVTMFEESSPQYDKKKTKTNGKIFTLDKDKSGDGKIDIDDLEWNYLEGGGDFNSAEVKKLRDEADIIITNPPFSLFRVFLAWIVEANKQFLIIGNMNAITYKELFPHIKQNKVWLGATNFNKGMYFQVPDDFIYADSYKFEREQNGVKVNRVPGVCWFTNIDHGRRHQPFPLMSMADNIKFSRHKEIKGKKYKEYVNYDAIEIPFADGIPNDYEGEMGVPISFLDKYCPEQFEIVGSNLTHGIPMAKVAKKGTFAQGGPSFYTDNGDGTFKRIYTRILIKHKNINK